MSDPIKKDTDGKGLVLVNLDYAKQAEKETKDAAKTSTQQVKKATPANINTTEETDAHREEQRRQESVPSKSNEACKKAEAALDPMAPENSKLLEEYFISLLNKGGR